MSDYEPRPVRWTEMVQRVRAYEPLALLTAIAVEGARLFDGGPLRVRSGGLQPWALAGLARESLANGNHYRRSPITPRTLPTLHNLWTNLEDPFLESSSDASPWDVMLRLTYEQLGWQGASFPEMSRVGALLDRDFGTDYERLSRTSVQTMLGAEPNDYIGAALVFTVGAQLNNGTFDLAWIDQPQFEQVRGDISADILKDVFAKSFAGSFVEAACRAREHRNVLPSLRRFDQNPLVATPLIQAEGSLYVAPVTKMVADRASLQAIYHLGQAQWKDAFTRDLGKLLEAYTGEQLNHVPGALVSPERVHGRRGGRRTVDWIVVLPAVVVLVEVKSARVAHLGRLDQQAFIEDVKRDVGKGFTQINATAQLVQNGDPAVADIPMDRPLRGIVVTAEPHFLINTPTYRRGLPEQLIPTTVLSLEELEHAVSLSLVTRPDNVMLCVTEWDAGAGVDVARVTQKLYDDSALERWDNPILDAAWAKYPFKR